MKDIFIEIKNRIDKYGYHRYLIKPHKTPRYSYTIGLLNSLGFELLLGGAIFYENTDDLELIFKGIINVLLKDKKARKIHLKDLGNFEIREVDSSWSSLMMLGALDYYNLERINTFQIFPIDNEKSTLDTPDMTKPWGQDNKTWKYLDDTISWNYDVPESSLVFTNLDALRGCRLTEYFRFELNEWEIFSGNGAKEPKKSIRIVPLSVLIGIDSSIENIINDPVGKGKFRDSSNENNMIWYNWE
ncbi:hypothetical protein MMU07_12250 [Aquiflexum sp. LQ15W]|uniref:hypothetical protein n=1 Tax=Cognataquiflexum nitidum TaxID=2922272 RepID=UPI001F12C27D|nr:hypothetical protein [Cognataquiflexum nitidum]MCH6200354.1 hypothetical protein [Cognataquiflexum nitidum]